jgi:hypothetical protein
VVDALDLADLLVAEAVLDPVAYHPWAYCRVVVAYRQVEGVLFALVVAADLHNKNATKSSATHKRYHQIKLKVLQ